MKQIHLLIIFLLVSLHVKGQTAECDWWSYAPVMGTNNRCYLNHCYLEKAGGSMRKDSLWNKKDYKKKDYYTWSIEKVCTPIRSHEVIKDLKDGTFIYKHYETKKLFRGNQNTCRCLDPETGIETGMGLVKVSDLRVGDSVFTMINGQKVLSPLLAVEKREVSKKHYMIRINFQNDSGIIASPEHHLSDYQRVIGSLKAGEWLNGKQISKVSKTSLKGKYTYDILPAGATGVYFANGVLLGSTLFEENDSVPLRLQLFRSMVWFSEMDTHLISKITSAIIKSLQILPIY